MYGREQRVLLRPYMERGLRKAEIARELGVSRRTVYHWIEGGQLDRDLDNVAVQYTPRPAVACRIDAFRPIIPRGTRPLGAPAVRNAVGASSWEGRPQEPDREPLRPCVC